VEALLSGSKVAAMIRIAITAVYARDV